MDSAIHTRPQPEVEDPHAARKPPRCSRQRATFWPGAIIAAAIGNNI